MSKRSYNSVLHVKGKNFLFDNARINVLNRDNDTCKHCGSKSDITVHHVMPVSEHPEWAYDEDNMITLCRKCHVKVHAEDKK